MRGLSPSIISADQARFGECLKAVEPWATSWHVDVMDGHYVPNLTIGPSTVEAITRISQLPQDVHLMITNPAETWEWYAKAGASRIAFHPETAPDASVLLGDITAAGLGAGIAVNPDVEAASVRHLLEGCEFVIVMTVYPGFSGQRFIAEVMPKLAELRAMTEAELVVDGGVSMQTAATCLEHGADVLVSASAVFGADDPAAYAASLAGMSR